ncbi:TCTP-domain-containing protein [Sporormia fimetaria CBS 119925]|uniref:Translationally-controlled tumor protein homolog n=1 Tax=Sporormia fimetaria CBS 119925 TaxID=1340428 RepID=A0A6A6V0R2_9PLEO|nr:TCTP-domain-containing protein [Sporormia fimetaria CBS 119925]
MIIYKDLITGDEIISDSYDLKEIDGVVYEADCKKITIGAENIDIGANPSAEEADEGTDDQAQTVIDVVHSFRLNETSFDKKSYLTHLKSYMKKVKDGLKEKGASDEEITTFEKGAQTFAKKIVGNFKDYEFLIGESMDPDGMVILLNYREDGVTPYVTVWKHGLTEMKVLKVAAATRNSQIQRMSDEAALRNAADISHQPHTPHKPKTGAGEVLNDLIRKLDEKHRLGIQPRSDHWTPKKNNSLQDKIPALIKRLFYTDEPKLAQVRGELNDKAPGLQQKEKLELLYRLLQKASPHPSQRTPLPTPQTDTDSFHRTSSQATGSSRSFPLFRRDEADSIYTTALESGDTTAAALRSGDTTDEDDAWSPPPSPSASARSAREAVGGSGDTLYVLPGHKDKKRPSQSSHDEDSSPRVTKVSRDERECKRDRVPMPASVTVRRPVESSTFKVPTLEMARSYQSTRTSFNSSFKGANLWSSQQTSSQETAATSFNSDYPIQSFQPKIQRTKSTTLGSADDDDFLQAEALTRGITRWQAFNRASTSTTRSSTDYGSLDAAAVEEICRNMEFSQREQSLPVWDSPGPAASRAESRQADGPPKGDASVSPSKISHRIRDIPDQNLFGNDISDDLTRFPYFILFICYRLAAENEIELPRLLEGMDPAVAQADPDAFWAHIHDRLATSSTDLGDEKVWSAANESFNGYTFKGEVAFNKSASKSIFSLTLFPLAKESSCRLQRRFGSDRFLYLKFPSMQDKKDSSKAGITRPQMKQIEKTWVDWFVKEHSFLGRKWRAFHVEPEKRKKGSRKPDADLYGLRVILFATEGLGINEPCTVGQMIDWFFPLRKNGDQSYCKAFARLDLALSRTVPTLVFKPSQIRRVEDILADRAPEDTQFCDFTLPSENTTGEPEVMNDGCSRISLGAAQEIWATVKKSTGRNDRMPTAFQGRIGGAKGLWVVDPESQSTLSKGPPPIWIEVSNSQLKFEPHDADLRWRTCDPLRLTFEVVNYSTPPISSDLHLSFIPIMVDRGVPVSSIEDAIITRLDVEREEMLDQLGDPAKAYVWVDRHSSAALQDPDDMPWQASLPSHPRDKAKLLLESGFRPTQERYLGITLSRLVQYEHQDQEKNLRIPLAKSAFVYGIADPLGVLAPGEVHLQFSTRFEDDLTKESFLGLEDIEVLVARQPACRRSDIQKVKAISHAKLGHLLDVVVFPSRGQYPLAGKLQGGDYDGDIFWVCWEPDLVAPFKNAPAPTQKLDHSRYGIKQENIKLGKLLGRRDSKGPDVDSFLKKAAAFRIQPSLLGQVTNYLEKQAYAEGKTYSDALNALCDMHDLLVDAPKQGYVFGDTEYDRAKKDLGLSRVLDTPAYKAAMDEYSAVKDMGAAERLRKRTWTVKKGNAIDYLYFDVVKAHHAKTQRLIDEELFSKKVSDDEELMYPCRLQDRKHSAVIRRALHQLLLDLEPIHTAWSRSFAGVEIVDSDMYNKTVEKCYKLFHAIQPDDPDDPELRPWFENSLSPNSAFWPTLRASALYTLGANKEKNPTFIYHLAGKELAQIKYAHANARGSHSVVGTIYATLRSRRLKTPTGPVVAQVEDDEEEEDFFSTAGTTYDL